MDNNFGDFHWLHFSDLHLSPKAGFNSEFAKEQLIEFLREETINGRLPYDYIFITGDIVHGCDYSNVQDFISKLFKALNCTSKKYNQMFWAVGNHDIYRDNKLRKLTITKILRNDSNSEQLFEELMNDTEFYEIFRLLQMPNGQYELKRRDVSGKQGQSGLDHNVIDHYNGTERDAKTLSGGESFIAALSLALGLSGEIQTNAGGIRLDSMFVDEGFIWRPEKRLCDKHFPRANPPRSVAEADVFRH